jgi:hypothetical protein
MAKKRTIILEQIEPMILTIRGQKVMLDADLARLYGASTKQLNQQVKRNRSRFPADFLFTLTAEEKAEVVTNCDHLRRLRFSPTLPTAFTEHGAIMAATILSTPRAVEMSVYVVRVFVKLRRVLLDHHELALKLAELERKVEGHDDTIRSLVAAVRELMIPPPEPKRGRIGFWSPSASPTAKTKHPPPT